jgi:hypothetical protein
MNQKKMLALCLIGDSNSEPAHGAQGTNQLAYDSDLALDRDETNLTSSATRRAWRRRTEQLGRFTTMTGTSTTATLLAVDGDEALEFNLMQP